MGGAIFPRRYPDEPPIFIDGSRVKPCSSCMVLAEFLCDFLLGKGKTCHALLCGTHAIAQGRRPANQLTLLEFDDGADDNVLHFCIAHEFIARTQFTT